VTPGRIVALDASPEMLGRAHARAPPEGADAREVDLRSRADDAE